MSRFKDLFTSQGGITKGALILLFLEAGFSLVFAFLGEEGKGRFAATFAASGFQVWEEGKVWTLGTSPFFEPRLLGLLFHGFLLWTFFPVLERWWGTARFLRFFVAVTLPAFVVGTLTGYLIRSGEAITGLDAFIFAGIVAFGVLYANRPVQFFGVLPMKGKQLAFGITGFVLVFILVQKAWAEGATFATAMAIALLLASGKWNPKLWRLRAQKRRARKHLRVVKGPQKGGHKKDNKKFVN